MSTSKFVPLVSLLAADFKGILEAIFNNICEPLAPWMQCYDECSRTVVLQSMQTLPTTSMPISAPRDRLETPALGLQSQ